MDQTRSEMYRVWTSFFNNFELIPSEDEDSSDVVTEEMDKDTIRRSFTLVYYWLENACDLVNFEKDPQVEDFAKRAGYLPKRRPCRKFSIIYNSLSSGATNNKTFSSQPEVEFGAYGGRSQQDHFYDNDNHKTMSPVVVNANDNKSHFVTNNCKKSGVVSSKQRSTNQIPNQLAELSTKVLPNATGPKVVQLQQQVQKKLNRHDQPNQKLTPNVALKTWELATITAEPEKISIQYMNKPEPEESKNCEGTGKVKPQPFRDNKSSGACVSKTCKSTVNVQREISTQHSAPRKQQHNQCRDVLRRTETSASNQAVKINDCSNIQSGRKKVNEESPAKKEAMERLADLRKQQEERSGQLQTQKVQEQTCDSSGSPQKNVKPDEKGVTNNGVPSAPSIQKHGQRKDEVHTTKISASSQDSKRNDCSNNVSGLIRVNKESRTKKKAMELLADLRKQQEERSWHHGRSLETTKAQKQTDYSSGIIQNNDKPDEVKTRENATISGVCIATSKNQALTNAAKIVSQPETEEGTQQKSLDSVSNCKHKKSVHRIGETDEVTSQTSKNANQKELHGRSSNTTSASAKNSKKFEHNPFDRTGKRSSSTEKMRQKLQTTVDVGKFRGDPVEQTNKKANPERVSKQNMPSNNASINMGSQHSPGWTSQVTSNLKQEQHAELNHPQQIVADALFEFSNTSEDFWKMCGLN